MEKNTPMPIEIVDGQKNSSWLIAHETKALNVTIGFHTNKVVFNIISSPRNHVIIGLSCLALHNPQLDWHTKNLHFETPHEHKVLKCETFVGNMHGKNQNGVCHLIENMREGECMKNLKQKEVYFNNMRKLRCPKPLFTLEQKLSCMLPKRRCILDFQFSLTKCWATSISNSFPIQRIEGYVWEEECKHLAQASTIRLHRWSWRKNPTSIWTHLQFATRWICSTSWIHQQNFKKKFIQHSKFLTNAFILFVKKTYGSLQMCVN